VLVGNGHSLTKVMIEEFATCPQTFTNVMLPEALQVHRETGWWPVHEAGYGRDTAMRLRTAEGITDAQRSQAMLDRGALNERMRTFFQDFDLLLTPSAAIAAPTMQDCDEPFVNGVHHPIRDLLFPFQVPAPLCGMPALAIPSGMTSEGLPTSVMISAAPRYDRLLLAITAQITKETR
jgi:amidase